MSSLDTYNAVTNIRDRAIPLDRIGPIELLQTPSARLQYCFTPPKITDDPFTSMLTQGTQNVSNLPFSHRFYIASSSELPFDVVHSLPRPDGSTDTFLSLDISFEEALSQLRKNFPLSTKYTAEQANQLQREIIHTSQETLASSLAISIGSTMESVDLRQIHKWRREHRLFRGLGQTASSAAGLVFGDMIADYASISTPHALLATASGALIAYALFNRTTRSGEHRNDYTLEKLKEEATLVSQITAGAIMYRFAPPFAMDNDKPSA